LHLGQGGPKATIENWGFIVEKGPALKRFSIIGWVCLFLLNAISAPNLAWCTKAWCTKAWCTKAYGTEGYGTELYDVELRILWGGPANRQYVGNIEIQDGFAKSIFPISMQADSSHSVKLRDNRTIELLPSSPTRYGGAGFQIAGSDQTKLRITLNDPSSSPSGEADRSAATNVAEPRTAKAKVLEVTLAEVLQQSRSMVLDQQGSSIVIERPTYDKIRPILRRTSLIFAPDEPIPLSCTGHHLGLGQQQGLRLTFSLLESSTGTILQSHHASITTDQVGSFAETSPATFYAPKEEGVYRIEIRADSRRMLGALLSDAGVSRSLEFVVMQSSPMQTAWVPWTSIETWEPAAVDVLTENGDKNRDNSPAGAAERNRWLSWRNLGNRGGWWNNLTRQSTRSPVKQTVERGESVMGPNDWYLTPLKIQAPGQPHRLLVRYSCAEPMQLGLTVLEPNGEGRLSPLGVNSGVQISSDDLREIQGTGETEIIFWPKTAGASLLVTNPDSEHSLRLLGYELFAGPAQLESNLPLAAFPSETFSEGRNAEGENATSGTTKEGVPLQTSTAPLVPRVAAIYLDKPLLAEFLGGPEILDQATGRGLHAWQSYYTACKHLVEYLKWSGHNGVVLFVAGEGGSLYPSEFLYPNSKFDRGRFFADGRDPTQKDVVELLLRMLDREGLHALLGIHFDGSMDPDLIRTARAPDPVELVDLQGNRWSQAKPNVPQQPPRYNPLNPIVREQMTRSLLELADRYRDHPSFRGVVVEMGGTGHLSFAGDRWGYDPESVQIFAKSLNAQLPTDVNELTAVVQSRLRGAFMQWRANQLTLFLQQIAQRIRKERSDLRLVVSTAGLAKQPPTESDFVEWSELWMPADYIALSRGLDLNGLSQVTEIDLLHADVRFPLHSLPQQRWSYGVRDIAPSPAGEHRLPRGGSLLLLPPMSRNWPSVEKQQHLNQTNSKVWTFLQVAPHAPSVLSSWSERLLIDDAWLMASGGWSPNFGSEKWMRDAARHWIQLPPVRMENSDYNLGQPLSRSVILRTATFQNKSFLFLVNASPWTENCSLEWNQAPSEGRIHLVNTSTSNVPESWYNKQWSIQLKPFQWQTIIVDTPGMEIVHWNHQPEEAAIEIAKTKLNDLSERVKRLHTTRLAASESLVNGGFETFTADEKPDGWTFSTLPSTQVLRSNNAYRGNSSLKLENNSSSDASLWLQSSPVRLPKTGRIAVELWIRKEVGSEEPKVRLMLQGRRSDGTRYERTRYLGKDAADAPISDRWETAPLVLLVSDLPTSGIDELRVEVDLIGKGIIYVDEVKVYDVYLHPDERNLIRNEIFAASEPFRDPSLMVRLDEIDRLWKGYWGEYLRRYVPLNPSTTGSREPRAELDTSASRELSQQNTENLPEKNTEAKPKPAQSKATTQQSPGLLRRRLGNLRGGGATVDR
jgi:hypothetical protein